MLNHQTELIEEPEKTLSSETTDSGLEETCQWENEKKIKTENTNLPIINKTSRVKLPLDRKEWLMDYMRSHAKNLKNHSADINREDCIIIKVTTPKFASQLSNFNNKLNFQNLLHEGYKNNLKACEKI